MKKILKLLTAINTVTPVIIATSSYEIQQQNKIESNNEYKIDMITKQQEKNDWCGIAALQAIYRSITKKEITQQEIAKAVFENYPSEWGTNARHIYSFLNTNRFLTNIKYVQKPMNKGCGTNDSELLKFQNYIKNSLINGAPIIVNYYFNDDSETKIGHTCLISGIKIDEHQLSKTIYYVWDPANNITCPALATICVRIFYLHYMGDIFIGEKLDKDNMVETKVIWTEKNEI